ncbi:MAG: hypothetical protein WA102_07235 [Candidatus Methanoperedens sp.]
MIRGKIISWIAAIAIVSSLISGCVSPPTGTPTPVVTPVMTPTATATPMTTPTPGASVVVLTAPATAVAGQGFVVSWRVNNPAQVNIQHTAIHYGPVSKSEPLTLASYPSLTTPIAGMIPAEFNTTIVINKAGVVYFRAHAIIGGANYWSGERMINITAPLNTTSIPSIATSTATATTSGYGY